jgi:hypothetical protein
LTVLGVIPKPDIRRRRLMVPPCPKRPFDASQSNRLLAYEGKLRPSDDMSDTPKHNKLNSDCTLPPDHPLPADQLGRYSPERNFYVEKEIAEYVEGQARGEEMVQ